MFEAKRLAPTSVQCIDREARKYPPTLLLFDRHEAWEYDDDDDYERMTMVITMIMKLEVFVISMKWLLLTQRPTSRTKTK